ncbi:hypothetical protein TA3x_000430 [Tundrisphaera sp. TA3]|uniref:hypothetical protein n=1 Tax=Tundrisphaera sp. TA3 TaxID=3435775 RepID=UPI003EBA04EF
MSVHPLNDLSPVAQAKTILTQAMNAVTLLEGTEPDVLTRVRLGPGEGMTAEAAIEELRESLWELKRAIIAQRRGYREF